MKSLLLTSLLIFAYGCELQVEQPAPAPSDRCPNGQCPNCPTTDQQSPWKAVPPVDVPLSLREPNYNGGSCMHAALITVLRSQNQNEIADYWRANFDGAAGVETCSRIADSLGLRFAYTVDGDEAFLEWCNRTRRAAAIYYGDNHAITFCGYTSEGEAVLLDSNRVGHYSKLPKAEFLANWHTAGGAAMTTVYASIPANPWYASN